MPALSLRLHILAENGNEIGGLLKGLSAEIFNVQGGKIQPLINGAYTDNDMLVADELKDAVFRRNLLIIRDSDAYSVELYQAFKKHQKLSVIASVSSTDFSGLSRGAVLIIKKATIRQFKIGKRDGTINQDAILLHFNSQDTEINYVSNAETIVRQEVMKIIGGIATSVQGIVKRLGL